MNRLRQSVVHYLFTSRKCIQQSPTGQPQAKETLDIWQQKTHAWVRIYSIGRKILSIERISKQTTKKDEIDTNIGFPRSELSSRNTIQTTDILSLSLSLSRARDTLTSRLFHVDAIVVIVLVRDERRRCRTAAAEASTGDQSLQAWTKVATKYGKNEEFHQDLNVKQKQG